VPPSRCKHCGRTVKDYGGYESIILAKGVNVSDIWDDLSPVRHNSHKTRAVNELPLTLTRRVMHISGLSSGLLVDPFAGSGSTVVAAVEHGMRFSVCDIVPQYGRLIQSRLDKIK
jgi:site-specific DNA-methyltransferase (adenine-specific)